MPGARLGRHERRRIEDGLAAGRTYSDIAREIGRPVSTVTREIARNGPSGYRADVAQRAAERRARRAPVARASVPQAATTECGRDPDAVHDFEVRLTEMLVATGMPRMNARVLACLYTIDAGSLTSAELVRRLGVSPASISKAVGYLEAQGLIRRERVGRNRVERYLIDDDVWYQAMLANARTTSQLADAAAHGVRTLGADTPAGVRLAHMRKLLDRVGHDMLQAAEDWRRTRETRLRGPGDSTPGRGRSCPG
jgi:DNA-binding transcriptional regulator GbsR (MarR family)